MSMGLLTTAPVMEFILGRANPAIVLIPQTNALRKLAKGHQDDETLV